MNRETYDGVDVYRVKRLDKDAPCRGCIFDNGTIGCPTYSDDHGVDRPVCIDPKEAHLRMDLRVDSIFILATEKEYIKYINKRLT